MSGGETLPQLRAAMRAADQVAGGAAPHVHPRIEPAALAPLLAEAGFANPVVDIDRVDRCPIASLDRLVADLRRWRATNVLMRAPRRFLAKSCARRGQRSFAAGAEDGRTTEMFEILHFAAWTRADKR